MKKIALLFVSMFLISSLTASAQTPETNQDLYVVYKVEFVETVSEEGRFVNHYSIVEPVQAGMEIIHAEGRATRIKITSLNNKKANVKVSDLKQPSIAKHGDHNHTPMYEFTYKNELYFIEPYTGSF